MSGFRLFLAVIVIASCAPQARAQSSETRGFYDGISTAADLQRQAAALMAQADRHLETMLAVTAARTLENTLAPYDRAQESLSRAFGLAATMRDANPDAAIRAAAAEAFRLCVGKRDEWQVSAKVYDALKRIDLAGADAQARHYVERELGLAKLAGADRDDATRTNLLRLRDELTVARRTFNDNIRDGQGTVRVINVKELDGLPADFIAAHRPGSDGQITLTTQPPDLDPVMQFARGAALRQRMWVASQNVGYPANVDVLKRMLRLQGEIAQILGYQSWAEYDAATRMVGSLANAEQFLTRFADLSSPAATREDAELLKRKQQDEPAAATLYAWDMRYYTDVLRREKFSLDSQAVREYFPYDRVRDGVLSVTSRLFGVTYKKVNVPVWHESVEVYEASLNGQPLGRIYLDMHFRPDKFTGTAVTYSVSLGAPGQMPQTMIGARLPGGSGGGSDLLIHDQVRLFFHEFGHAMNALFAGHQKWTYLSRFSERDFAEVPSTMLEQWVYDPAALALMGQHHQTGQPIPAPLVEQLRRSSEFGRATSARNQLMYSRLALSLHVGAEPDLDQALKAAVTQWTSLPYVDRAHTYTGFTHLSNPGYTAGYYTYLWSAVIAQDLFTGFDKSNLLNSNIAGRFATSIFRAGGSRPAAASVREFLGRDFNMDAWAKWLNGSN